MFSTSLTTMISFFSNAGSNLPAIATFGFFAAMMIFVNYWCVPSLTKRLARSLIRTRSGLSWIAGLGGCWRWQLGSTPCGPCRVEDGLGGGGWSSSLTRDVKSARGVVPPELSRLRGPQVALVQP